jgi:hypothetical protein
LTIELIKNDLVSIFFKLTIAYPAAGVEGGFGSVSFLRQPGLDARCWIVRRTRHFWYRHHAMKKQGDDGNLLFAGGKKALLLG